MTSRWTALLALLLLGCGDPAPSRGGDGEACREGDLGDDGLICDANLCVPIPRGDEGQPCFPDESCSDGLVCEAGLCIPEPEPEPLVDPVRQVMQATPDKLDLLFVIDNSGSMREEQTSLALNAFFIPNRLEEHHGVIPDLHIGFVTTDMGAGPFGINGCTGNGDEGILQAVPANQDCTPPTGAFIQDAPGPNGERLTNYEGSLYDVFGCISRLGTTGCGFEQPLASLRAALDSANTANAGFIRDDATLAIVLVSDEDDCSASDVSMYNTDPALDNVDSELGFLSSYRCFEQGVVCDESQAGVASDRLLEGPRTNCEPREDSLYMTPVSDIVSFLKGKKAEPHHLIYQVIAGVGPVVTGRNENEPVLEPACVSASGEAAPAVRLDSVSRALGMGATQTICNDDLSDALRFLMGEVNARMSGRCLVESSDHDRCEFADTAGVGTAEEAHVQALPPCADEEAGPCVDLIPDSEACPTGAGIEVTINRRGSEVPANTQVVALCPR